MVGFKLPASSGNIANVATAFAIGIGVAAVAGVAVAAAVGGFMLLQQGRPLKPPWQLRKQRAAPLSPRQWRLAFDIVDGRLIGGGERVIGRVRRGGVDRTIRAEVWPFLLGLYNAGSTREEREQQRAQRRDQYQQLRRQCLLALKHLVNLRTKSRNEAEEVAAQALPVDNEATGLTTDSSGNKGANGEELAGSPDIMGFTREELDREEMDRKMEQEEVSEKRVGEEECEEAEDGDVLSEVVSADEPRRELCRSIPNSLVTDEADFSTDGGHQTSGRENSLAHGIPSNVLDRQGADRELEGTSGSVASEKLDHLSPEEQCGQSVNSQRNGNGVTSSNESSDHLELIRDSGEVEFVVLQARKDRAIMLENGCNDDVAGRLQHCEEAAFPGSDGALDPASPTFEDEGEMPEVISAEESKTAVMRSSDGHGFSLERKGAEPDEAKRAAAMKSRRFPEGRSEEDFQMWQRIIRLDAVRMNAAWIPYSKSQAEVSEGEAGRLAEDVGLTEHAHLDAPRRHHAARLVAILEAYALHDPDIGYCQGMSDLLSPFVAMIEDDADAFWCFERFMQKARQNFRVDELGIRKQLDMIARILKAADPRFFEYLCTIGAEDCIFAYRMAVVLLRRELTFEQTISLWEVVWADAAAAAAEDAAAAAAAAAGGAVVRNLKDGRPASTQDLLLFVIAAAIRKRRREIMERCRGMDEVLKVCNSLTGTLNIWDILDDARDLVRMLGSRV